MNQSNKDKILFKVSDDYISKLKNIDCRVQNNYHGERLYYKTNLGFDCDDGMRVEYLVPLSSSKEKQKNINNKTLFKIYGSNTHKDDFLGVLHLNNMIPVPQYEIKAWSPSETAIDERYKKLVIKQANYLRRKYNEINEDTKLLYDCKTENIDNQYFKENRNEVMFYKRIVNDVKLLEKFCLEDIKEKHEYKRDNEKRNYFDFEI